MNIRIRPGLAVVVLALVALVPRLQADDTPRVPADHAQEMEQGLALFKAKVRPALVQHCLDCHGGKAKKGGSICRTASRSSIAACSKGAERRAGWQSDTARR